MRNFTIFLAILFTSLLVIEIAESQANPIIVWMIKAEKTGNKTQMPPQQNGPQGGLPLPWYYEIKVEWSISNVSGTGLTGDLYRRSSPGAYPNGNLIANDVSWYDYDQSWDDLCWPPPGCWKYVLYFRHYDWALEDHTWYYMAEYASNEVSVTVP